MTDESSGNDLGTLEVGVVGNATELEAVLTRVENRLKELVGRDWKVNVGASETTEAAATGPAPTGGGNKRVRDPIAGKAAQEAKRLQDEQSRTERLAAVQRAEDKRVRDAINTRRAAERKKALAESRQPDYSHILDKPIPPARRTEGRLARIAGLEAAPAAAKAEAKTAANLTFKTGSVRPQVEKDLAEPFELKLTVPEVDIKLNIAGIRQQVLEAFSGLDIGVGSVGAARPSGETPAAAAQGSPTPHGQRSFTDALNATFKGTEGLSDSINSLYSQIARATRGTPASAAFNRDVTDGNEMDKLADIVQHFGVSTAKLINVADPKGNRYNDDDITQHGPLGSKALQKSGLNEDSAEAIAGAALEVVNASAGKGFLTSFMEELKTQPARPIAAPAPAMEPTPVVVKETPKQAAVAARPVAETPAAETAAPAKIRKADDFIDYIKTLAGDIDPTKVPAVKDIAIPASLAKKGDPVYEEIQAAKIAAGRSQGTQSGLGDVQKVLDVATKRVFDGISATMVTPFENLAYELDPKNRKQRTGRLIPYNPAKGPMQEETEGSRVAGSTGPVPLGGRYVERANPSELLATTLKALFPGIEKQSNPDDKMSSVLNRIMAGSGRDAVQFRGAMPGDRGAGSFAPGSGQSTLRSQVESAAATERMLSQDPVIKKARRAVELATMNIEKRLGIVGGMAQRAIPEDDALGLKKVTAIDDVGTAIVARDELQRQLKEKEAAAIKRRAATIAEADRAFAEENKARVQTNPGGPVFQAAERKAVGKATRAKIDSGELPGEVTSRDAVVVDDDGTVRRGQKKSLKPIYFDKMEEIAKSDLPMRSMMTGEGGFTENAIREALKPVDEAMYDALNLVGKARNPKSLDKGEHFYIGAERKAVIDTLRERNRFAQEALDRSPDGIGGRVPKEKVGSPTVTGRHTPSGSIETKQQYARSQTDLGIEQQSIEARLIGEDAVAARNREIREAKSQALRRVQKQYGARDVEHPDAGAEGLDLLSFKDEPTRKAARATYNRSIAQLVPPIEARQKEETTGLRDQLAHIRAVTVAADRFLGSIANVGTSLIEDDQGKKKRVGGPNIEEQRRLAANRPLTNLPEGVSEDEVRLEAKQVLDFHAAEALNKSRNQAAKIPGEFVTYPGPFLSGERSQTVQLPDEVNRNTERETSSTGRRGGRTKAGRGSRSGDAGREFYNRAGGLTPPGEEPPVGEPPFSSFNRELARKYGRGEGGVGVGGPNGRGFQPGGAPIEVIVVGKFPLPVEIMGGGSAEGGTSSRGKRRKNIYDQDSVGGKWRTSVEWVPEGSGSATGGKKAPAPDKEMSAVDELRGKIRDRYPKGDQINFNKTPRVAEGSLKEETLATQGPLKFNRSVDALAAQREREEKATSLSGQSPLRVDRGLTARERQQAREERSAAAAAAAQLKIQPINTSQVALEKQRAREENQAKAAKNRLMQSGRRRSIDNFDIEAEFQDKEQDKLNPLRSQLNRANRLNPSRGFGASLTDALTGKLGGKALEKQQTALFRASSELSEMARLRMVRADTLGKGKVLLNEKFAIRNERPTATPERQAEIDVRGKAIAGELGVMHTRLKELNPSLDRSGKLFKKAIGEATEKGTVAKAFGAAAIGGAAAGGIGALQFGLGGALIAPIQAGVGAVVDATANAADRIGGFAGTTARVTAELSDQVAGGAGPTERVVAQREAQLGFSAASAERLSPVIDERVTTEAGNKLLQSRIEELNSAIKIRGENIDRVGDKNLTETTGGVFGAGGTAPTSELISTQFDLLQTRGQRDQTNVGLSDAALALSQNPFDQQAGQQAQDALKSLADSESTIKFFNDALKKGGEGVLEFSTKTEKVSPEDRAAQERALRSVNAQGLADKVRDERVVLTEGGKAVTDPTRLIDALKAINEPKPEAAQLLKAQEDSLRAQAQVRELQSGLNLGTLLPAGRGIASAQEGDLKLSGREDLGFTQENRQLTNELNQQAAANRKTAIDFVRSGPPGLRQGEKDDGRPILSDGTGLGADKAEQFAAALNAASGYANQIADIQLGVQTQQASLAAKQYSYQIGIAKRSLQDAKALVGDIAGGTNNLGAIERQNFQLQRQSQTLSLELSQRQINFQRAIANFQAPGLTSEEREARKQAAKIEADFAQKQLDIQKKLFALAGKGFNVSARRSVTDQELGLGLLTEGREITINTAKAEKKIAALSKKRDKELATVSAIFQEAVDKTNAIITTTGELAAATGKDMGELANSVIQAYAKVYRGLIKEIQGSLPADPDQSSMGGWNPGETHAEGFIGSVNGATSLGQYGVAGEAGGEAVAILRDPQKLTMNPYQSGGGGTQVITINVTGNTVRKDDDLNEIARKVENVLNRRGSQLGLRPLGG